MASGTGGTSVGVDESASAAPGRAGAATTAGSAAAAMAATDRAERCARLCSTLIFCAHFLFRLAVFSWENGCYEIWLDALVERIPAVANGAAQKDPLPYKRSCKYPTHELRSSLRVYVYLMDVRSVGRSYYETIDVC